jgi:tetratricopeptide (TPR) repeat protein/tRNA A-37 threonylcarbamoyl transferase component Bud32/TolB-like protein
MSESLDRLRRALAARYEIQREVGAGGMATVYLATDLRHQRRVALKVLRPELAASLGPDRFLQEVRVTANLQHPHILPLFDSGEADGFLYYVMPFVDGESLRDRLTREGELPVAETARLLRDVVDALAAAHALGIVHRDVKPENILLSGRHALVTDFGVAKAVSEATGRHKLTTVGVAVGTPAYMAPEQALAEGSIDHRADIYALGAVAYELLTGRPPFSGRTQQQVLAAQVTEKPVRVTEHRSAVPPGLETLVMRCLEKKPADRWQRAEDMLPHLEAFSTPSGGVTPTQMVPAPRPRRAWMKVAVPAGVFVALAALVLAWPQLRPSGDAPEASVDPLADEPRRLIVVPLENLGADPDVDVWAQLAADWIGRAIDLPRPVDVVPAATVRDAIKALGPDASVAAVAEKLGARWAVAGSVARTGGQVRFEVAFQDVGTGERLRSLEPIVGPVDSVEAIVGRLADQAAAAAVALLDPGAPPWIATVSLAPSVQIYRDYLAQSAVFCEGRYTASIDAGSRILAQAPDFIPALALNRVASSNLGLNALADSLTQVLEGLRGQMTAAERADQDWMWGNIYGDPVRALRGADELYRLDKANNGYAAGLTYMRLNRLEGALERMLAVDLEAPCNSDWSPWWSNTTALYHRLGRYDEDLALARRGRERFPNNRAILDREIAALAALGRVAAVDSLLDFVETLPPATDDGVRPLSAALELRAHGQADAARRVLQRALEWYARQPSTEGGTDLVGQGRALALYVAGRLAEADSIYAELLERQPEDIANLRRRGAVLARLGRREEALEMARRLELLHGRPNNDGNHIAGQAEIAASLGDRDGAVRLLRRAFENGYGYSSTLHREPAFDGMWGYAPWETLMAPKP